MISLAFTEGPYDVQLITEQDGMRNGPNYSNGKVYFPANSNDNLPVIVMIPGFISYISSIEEWGPYLASYGFVTMFVNVNSIFEDPYARANAILDGITTIKLENERVNSPLNGKLNLDSLAVGGWSMGGGGAQIASQLDESIEAVIALSAWLPSASITSNNRVPVLFLSGQFDATATNSFHTNLHYNNTPNEINKLLFEISGGSHYTVCSPYNDLDMAKKARFWIEQYINNDSSNCNELIAIPNSSSSFSTNIECTFYYSGDLLEKRIRQDFTQNSFETYERISYRNEQELVNFIESLVQINNIPGVSVSVVKDDRIVLEKYFGFSNLSQNIPVNENTKFILSSVSKTVTATALMQLFEQDFFELDDDISDYLPFRIIHPDYPQVAITFKMLLTHTSGIKDNWSVMTYYDGDSSYELSSYVYDYFHPQGTLYNQNLNFNNSSPGTTFEYSNNAVALIGLLVQQLSGNSFSNYCKQNIFNPLGMNDTHWFLSEIENLDEVAFPYRWVTTSQNSCFEMGCGTYEDNLPCFCDLNCVSYGDCCSDYQSVCGESGTGANPNNLVENNHYGYSDYPSGQLRSTAHDMAKFMATFLNGGVYDGSRILDNDTIEIMKTIQNPSISSSQALMWYYKNDLGRELFGHNGGDIGSLTEMFISFADNIGVIVLTNTANYSTTIEIENALFDFAETTSFTSLGDINSDTLVNIQDVILLVNLILNQDYNNSADINSDQIIDILDVVQIISMILS